MNQVTPKLVVVAGAAGKLGRLVVDALLSRPGVRVRALVRDPQKPDVRSLARPGVWSSSRSTPPSRPPPIATPP